MSVPTVRVYQAGLQTHWIVATLDSDGGEGQVTFNTEAEAKAWATDWLERERRQRNYDRLICPWCSDMVERADVVNVRFTLDTGIGVSMDVCKGCQNARPCTANMVGVHGEIYDGEYDGAVPPLPFEPDGQHGWCSRCYAPMVWSPERQRWVDYPEELTEAGRLTRLMDARDAGHVTDEEYEREIVGLLP